MRSLNSGIDDNSQATTVFSATNVLITIEIDQYITTLPQARVRALNSDIDDKIGAKAGLAKQSQDWRKKIAEGEAAMAKLQARRGLVVHTLIACGGVECVHGL